MVFDNGINEIGEGLNTNKIESNLVNNIHLNNLVKLPEEISTVMRPRYVPAGHTTNFSLISGLSQGKLQSLKNLVIPQLAKLNIS